MEPNPRVSIVITWRYDAAHLGDMLRLQLPRRAASSGLDMIVVTAQPPAPDVAETFSDLRFITAAATDSVERMRTLGMQHALGDIVMLVDGTVDADVMARARSLAQ